MNKNFWDRIQDLKESINGGVEPLETIVFKTSNVKLALGVYLIQSILIALILSIKDHSFSAWMIPMSSLLYVGWIWNKVTDYWKIARGLQYSELAGKHLVDSVNPPIIDIHNEPFVINVPPQENTATDKPVQDLWHTAENII